ncbi:MAG: dihydroorotate dehydrogenase-like protein [Gammaproteobacteria bacterium]|nr:dihydroorotate dehydrogenase-like protein [Gammaproteobacteria bacterium]NIR98850.1 dihydroorotate dehydrogenase-like protein [Gammaproteobacteria bacterium]NIT63971.1 dihydroorotate dehydrogenase-like protein [Gammaproteobacteria bacterium]NIV19131.1 dihydroorotate dehydrogenase-like protein [Gammaproteobacteria bacterium]NIX10300.1 dihydroorotate dehydrogenase-like protein [Gammaproteobacteria bacterium]
MADLRTRYLGLELDHPVVPSASPLSRSLDSARELEDAGASAIVMYSLFEEELYHEEQTMAQILLEQDIGFGEMRSFLPVQETYKRALDRYLEQLGALKAHLSIPVIASLNGITLDGWVEHGRELQEAGADALELNVYYVAADPSQSSADVEGRYLELLRELRAQVRVPIAMKLSSQFSAIPHFVKQIEHAGADGVSLFNRFYQPDIDLEAMRVIPDIKLSTSTETLIAMRWIAILYGRVGLSLAATGGIHTTEDAVKMLLAGADVTHLCSTLLMYGPERLTEILKGVERWLERSDYGSLDQMRGSLSQLHVNDPAAFERANYVAALDSYSPAPGVLK